MSVLIQAATALQAAIKKDTTTKSEDKRYVRLRTKAEDLLIQYSQNPLDMDLIEQCDRLVDELKSLNSSEMSNMNYQRSQGNVVYISAQSKRTHYAAYVAGKWSTDKKLSGAFKAWMHNSAADGAISLYEAIELVERSVPGASDAFGMGMLKVFGQGSRHDGRRFLDLADEYYPSCVVTTYNRAKLDVFSRKPAGITNGVIALKNIPAPEHDCHPAELSWHIDNASSFDHDFMLREILSAENPDDIERIEHTLQLNGSVAEAILKARGESTWDKQTNYTKVLVVAAATGIAATLWVILGDGDITRLLEFLAVHSRIAEGAVEEYLAGGGGLFEELQQVRTVFGGGGLA